MKKFFHLLIAIVLISACKSDNGVRTYTNGRIFNCTRFLSEIIDTLSVEEFDTPLLVLVSNDTIFFNTSKLYGIKRLSYDNFALKIKNYAGHPYYGKVESDGYGGYFVKLKVDRFFDINNVEKVSFTWEGHKKGKVKDTVDIYSYDLDKDLLKYLNKR